MKQLLLAAVALLGVASSSVTTIAADWNPPIPQAMKPVNTVVAALNTGNVHDIAGLYSSDAVVIDDVAPSRWTGVAAGKAWLSDVTGRWGKFSTARFTTTATPAEITFTGGSAYIVVDGLVTGIAPGRSFRNKAAFTFTLRQVAGSWEITSQTFTPLF